VKVAEGPVAGRKLWKVLVPAAVVLVAVAIAGAFYFRSRQSTRRLTDKDTIVLADFSNSTGDPVFDDTLKTALSVALNQSPFLNVLSENKVVATLQVMSRPADTKLTPEVAREAGGQQGLHCGLDCQSLQPICAWLAGGELPERRPTGAGPSYGIGQREGAGCSRRGGVQAAGRTGQVAGNRAEI
jgi:hypothetical protein